MIIYDQEKEDGIDIDLLSKGSITYASYAEPCDQDAVISEIKQDKSIAGIKDKDLYYVQSILVTSNWNKNDDIFDKYEIWKAKDTPEDKPTNLEHDEGIIIGHITSNQPITDDGKAIDPKTDLKDLPEKYHILTGSVIYLGFTQDELKHRSRKLVAEIEAGTKYVSMECFFNNFDYGLINKSTGDYKVLGRDADSAYLTKYLRAYGGKGEFEDYKIGRVLRNITFSGKGFVDKPANENSIIFKKSTLDSFASEKNKDSEEKGVVDNNLIPTKSEKLIMSEETLASLEQKLDTVLSDRTKACDLQTQLEAANEQVTQLKAEKIKNEEEKAEKEKKEKAEKEKMKKEEEDKKAEAETLMKSMQEELAMLKEEAEKFKNMAEEYRNQAETLMLEKKKAERMQVLSECAVEASEETEAMLTLSDEDFESVVAVLRKMTKAEEVEEVAPEAEVTETTEEAEATSEESDTEQEEDKAEESVADAEILEKVEFEDDVSLAVSEEDSVEAELQSTRAALIDFVKSRLQITK